MLVPPLDALLAGIARGFTPLLAPHCALASKVCARTKDWLFRVGILAHLGEGAPVLRGKNLLKNLLGTRARAIC